MHSRVAAGQYLPKNYLSMAMHVSLIRAKFLALKPVMDERLTRLWAGAEAEALGAGGITLVAAATGMSRTTIRAGRDELRKGVAACDVVRVRRAGAARGSRGAVALDVEEYAQAVRRARPPGVLDQPTEGRPAAPRRRLPTARC